MKYIGIDEDSNTYDLKYTFGKTFQEQMEEDFGIVDNYFIVEENNNGYMDILNKIDGKVTILNKPNIFNRKK